MSVMVRWIELLSFTKMAPVLSKKRNFRYIKNVSKEKANLLNTHVFNHTKVIVLRIAIVKLNTEKNV